MPGIFQAGPETLHLARKPGIIFHSPEFLKHMTNFLNLILRISTNICVNRVQSLPETGFYDVKYQNSRPTFTAARNIFLEK